MIAALLALSAAAEPTTLEQAYQREFAYLHGEKKALQARLHQLDIESVRRIATAESELESLQARLIRLQTQADQAQDLLDGAERQSTTAIEDADRVDTMLFQARTTLDRDGFSLGDAAVDAAGRADQVAAAVTEGVVRVDEGRTLRRTTGPYFLEDGTEKEGELLLVGNIAAYAVEAGALAPAGQGRLQLRRPDGVASATQLLHGGDGPISLFLFESLDKAVPEDTPKTLGSVLASGGLVGWVIVALGLAGLALVLLRAFSLFTTRAFDDALTTGVTAALRRGDAHRAAALAGASDSAAGRVIAGILSAAGATRAGLEDAATRALLAEQSILDRFGAPILVIAAVAPLLGLLGTVTGMIETFDVITEYGTGDPKMLSGGISAALVTTQLGLIVAIPLLLLGNLLRGRADTCASQLERTALEMLALVEAPDGGAAPAEAPSDATPSTPTPPRLDLETSLVEPASA